MPRTITYEILDRPDGRFSVTARMEPDRVYRRDDLGTLAEAEEWVEGLRILMAACGAPVVLAGRAAGGGPDTARRMALRESWARSGASSGCDAAPRRRRGPDTE